MSRTRILLTGNPSFEVIMCLAYYLWARKLLQNDVELLFDGIDARTDVDADFGIEACPEGHTRLEFEAERHGFTPDPFYVKLFEEHNASKRLVKKPYLNSFAYLCSAAYRDEPKSGPGAHLVRLRIVSRILRVATTFIEALAHPETAAALKNAEKALESIEEYPAYATMERGSTEAEIAAYDDIGKSVGRQAVQLAKPFPFSQGFRKATGRKHQGLPLPFTLAGYLTVLFLQGKDVNDENAFYVVRFYGIRGQVDRTKQALYADGSDRIEVVAIPRLDIRCALIDIESDHDANNVFNDVKTSLIVTRDRREDVASFAIMANTSDQAAVNLVERAGAELQRHDPNGWTVQKSKGRMVVLVAKGLKRTPKDADMNVLVHMLFLLAEQN